jgi:phospholipase C
LYPKSEVFDGLDGSERNPWHRLDGSVEDVRVWNSPAIRPEAACIPNRELGELFADINMQLYGLETVQDGAPSMRGFVDNFMRQPPEAVMHCFKPAQVPVLSHLATAFGVSDRWHVSAPCETWPNRYFAHAGTGGGYVNNEFLPLPRLNLRIADDLSAARRMRLPLEDLFTRPAAAGDSRRFVAQDTGAFQPVR